MLESCLTECELVTRAAIQADDQQRFPNIAGAHRKIVRVRRGGMQSRPRPHYEPLGIGARRQLSIGPLIKGPHCPVTGNGVLRAFFSAIIWLIGIWSGS
jgi:hypothetical protein